MIQSIRISNTATFGITPEELSGLSLFNFIYGANGSGKTTISRIVAGETEHSSCQVQWKDGLKLQPMVYNHDFIDRNFNQSNELKGVFTLGETHADTIEKIAKLKSEIDELTTRNSNLTDTLQGVDGNGGKKSELQTLENEFREKVWELKKKYDDLFKDAFKGLRNDKEAFRDRFFQESKNNTADLITFDELKEKATSIFGEEPVSENLLETFDATDLLDCETNPIMSKSIVGKDDVDIAAMIKKLGNSDWVKTGRSFYNRNDGICPFCQQSTPLSFQKSLEEYFDETFINDSKELEALNTLYVKEIQNIENKIQSITANHPRFLDIEKFKKDVELFLTKSALNQQRLNEKKAEPSRTVKLEPMKEILDSIGCLIKVTNDTIAKHNNMVANLSSEKNVLTSQVWRFILDEINTDTTSYKSKKENLEKAISGIQEKISKNDEEKRQKEVEVRTLEKQTTSIQPTIDGINGLLRQFGFSSFSLAKSSSGNLYRLQRPNGSDAKMTLSEGEKTFVCFLYFYHLLRGSLSESGITTDRIVVIDDPVSSLDSDILFIVSSLIKGLFDDIRNNTGHIKQIVVLTHNAYFHKEITFNKLRRNNQAMNEETFFTVRKDETGSKVVKWNENPIKTSYDLLWSEIRSEQKSALTIQNTLRRILENYFKILGGIDTDKICEMFEGKEKCVCKSLFSWVNDGSHFAHDDLYVAIDSSQIENYLSVFRRIFEKSEHISHYKMMMGEAYIEETAYARPCAPAEEGAGLRNGFL